MTTDDEILDVVMRNSKNLICSCPSEKHLKQTEREHNISIFTIKMLCKKAIALARNDEREKILKEELEFLRSPIKKGEGNWVKNRIKELKQKIMGGGYEN